MHKLYKTVPKTNLDCWIFIRLLGFVVEWIVMLSSAGSNFSFASILQSFFLKPAGTMGIGLARKLIRNNVVINEVGAKLYLYVVAELVEFNSEIGMGSCVGRWLVHVFMVEVKICFIQVSIYLEFNL